MTGQLVFDFGATVEEEDPYVDLDGKGPYGPLAFPSPHPIVVFRWDDEADVVTSEWSEFNLKASFKDWRVALDVVLHENNAHVSVRVRT
jgi:hypothetical protein